MFLLRIAEAMVASQESFLNSPENVQTHDYVQVESDREALHRLADRSLNEPMMAEGSAKLSRIKLACSRDSSASPSPNSITTVSVHTHSPSLSNPSPCVSICSPVPSSHLDDYSRQTQQHDLRPGSRNGQTHQGLLYSLLIGGETGSSSTATTGLARSPFLVMSPMQTTHSRAPSGNSVHSANGGLRRSHTQNSLELDDIEAVVDKRSNNTTLTNHSDGLKNHFDGVRLSECTSRLAAVLTASEGSVANGGASKFIRDQSLCSSFSLQQRHHHQHKLNSRGRANSLGANKLSQIRPYFRPHAVSVGSNGESCYPSLKSCLQPQQHQQQQQQQQRRNLDVTALREVKTKLSPRYRSFSKTALNKQSNSLSRSHSLNTTNSALGPLGPAPPPTTTTLPPPPPSTASPRLRLQQSLSAPFAQRVAVSNSVAPALLASTRSSGYCSAGLNASPVTSLSTDSGLDEPVDLTGQGPASTPAPQPLNGVDRFTTNGNTHRSGSDAGQLVQLAKKTARPVQARVTEWMRQVAEFVALSAPVLRTMSPSLLGRNGTNGHARESSDMQVWLVLLGKCWHRLLALNMVEQAMDLVVVEDTSADERQTMNTHDSGQTGLPWLLLPESPEPHGPAKLSPDRSRRPDRTFANAFLQFLSEVRQASLSAQEFYLLRHVILLSAHEPMSLPALGLNVIRASRQVNPHLNSNGSVSTATGSQGSSVKLKSQSTTGATASVTGSSEELKQSFDLACLACGLKALSVLCPYRTANLFCSHLRTSNTLNGQFLMELHQKYITSVYELEAVSSRTDRSIPSPVRMQQQQQQQQLSSTNERTVNGNGMVTVTPASTTTPNTTSILEQLFDSS